MKGFTYSKRRKAIRFCIPGRGPIANGQYTQVAHLGAPMNACCTGGYYGRRSAIVNCYAHRSDRHGV